MGGLAARTTGEDRFVMDLTEVSEVIRADIAGGRGTRATLGAKGAVFGVSDGLPPTIAAFSEQASSAGMSFEATTISASATTAKKTAEGAAKPNALAFTTAPVSLAKYSGLAELTLERQISSQGIAMAIYNALAGQALMAYESDAYAALGAAVTEATDATSYLGGIAAAQAALLSMGARPGVVVIPASVYADVVGEVVAGPGFGSDPRSPVGTIFGSLVHVSSASGSSVYVADPAALLAITHEDSPMVISDPFTKADTNVIRLVLDVVGTFVVSNLAGVAGFTYTPVGTRSGSTK